MDTEQPPKVDLETSTTSPTRELLLDTVRSLVTKYGDVSFSLSDVAKASGKNSALVSYHFGGKEQMLLAVLEADAKDVFEPLNKLAHSNHPPVKKMRMHLTGSVRLHAEKRHLNIMTRVLLRRSSEESARKIADQYVMPVVAAQAKILKEGHAAGEFRKVDPFAFYMASMGAVDLFFAGKATVNYAFGRSRSDQKDIDVFARSITDLMMRTLAP